MTPSPSPDHSPVPEAPHASPSGRTGDPAGLPADELARRRAGLGFGIACYTLWGGLPLIFRLAEPATSTEILAHRIVWSLVFCFGLLAVARGFTALGPVLKNRKLVVTLCVASVIVAANWLIFLFGVEIGRVVDVSLGYYINPLVTVAVGVIALRNRLRPLQWVAMGIGLVAVIVLSVGTGEVPWLSLGLAGTFAVYGYIKSRVGKDVGAIQSLTIETAFLTPFAGIFLIWLTATGGSHFGTEGAWHTAVMLLLGPITAVPLVLFAAASSRVPLVWMGMMQYLAPTIQFVISVTMLGEEMAPARWAGFFIIWGALVVLTVDGILAARRNRRLR